MTDTHDIVVIGAGPVGLYAGSFASEKGLRVAVVDALSEVGGQLTALYPQKSIFDVAGYPEISAKQLVENLKRQLIKYHALVMLGFRVASLSREENGDYLITSDDKREVRARSVIVAAGAGLISPRKLELADAVRYEGRGLEYVVSDPESYRKKRVLVIGGGDTALDWANFFVDRAAAVTLIHRSSRFVGFEGSLQALLRSSCAVHTDTTLTGIFGDGKVESVQMANSKEGWNKTLEVDRILGCIGFTPRLGFIKEAGFEIAEGSIKADSKMRTGLPHVYAVGDISNHPGRIKLISTGFGNVQAAIGDILQPTDIID
jgi:ferredoxin/flavodoxin---NADP+ reductase